MNQAGAAADLEKGSFGSAASRVDPTPDRVSRRDQVTMLRPWDLYANNTLPYTISSSSVGPLNAQLLQFYIEI
jgi:hypothetical protein